jgi:acyl-CoA synthetase (AMP-forming)/AMP-acid ligase II
LRGSKTPALVVIREALPQTSTGKVLRRELLAELLAADRGSDVMTGQLLHDMHPFNGSDNDA